MVGGTLYSSTVTKWRQQREVGALEALSRRGGRKAVGGAGELRRLKLENARLSERLEGLDALVLEHREQVGLSLASSLLGVNERSFRHRRLRAQRLAAAAREGQATAVHASAPNIAWSWVITKLRGPNRGDIYFLNTILDIYSRFVVGWHLAERENATIAEHLFRKTARAQGIQPEQLLVHADRGGPMVSGTLYDLFEDALAWCERFFAWYNDEHYHSGIGYLTPRSLHEGTQPPAGGLVGKVRVSGDAARGSPRHASWSGLFYCALVDNCPRTPLVIAR